MKRLLLLRHAKSSWDEPSLRDHDRPLADRGRHAAPAIAAFVAREELEPDLVLCSTSARTRETWAHVEPRMHQHVVVEFTRDVYHAGAADLLDMVQTTDDGVDTLMVIGHNPGMAVLASVLAGTGPPEAMASMASKFPTAALAVIRFDVDSWAEVERDAGELEVFIRPKDLRG